MIVNGNWTDWVPVTNCSQSICGTGFLMMNRSCTNPAPKFNGSDCVGNTTQFVSCQVAPCPDEITDSTNSSKNSWLKDGSSDRALYQGTRGTLVRAQLFSPLY